MNKKLNIGAGTDILNGWVNHDFKFLEGIDVIHDLSKYPWPWGNSEFIEIKAKDILEHLPNLIANMEEIYRITQPKAKIYISVPYWNSWEAITDPTHILNFNEYTFNFFDPTKDECKYRPYYTNARFFIKRIGYGIQVIPHLDPTINSLGRYKRILGWAVPWRYTVIYNPFVKWILGVMASYLNNIIIGLEIELERCE